MPDVGNTSNMTDGQLLGEYAKTASHGLFAEIVRRYSSAVYSVCLRILKNTHDAEDVAQVVFALVARKSKKLSSRDSLAGWVLTTARLVSMERLRSVAIQRKHEKAVMDMTAVNERSSDEWVEQVREHLDEAISRLPSRLKDVVVMHHLCGESEVDVARKLSCTTGTVYTRLSRGLEKVRGSLRRRGYAVPSVAMVPVLDLARKQVEVPAGLADRVLSVASGKTTMSSSAAGLLKQVELTLLWTKIRFGAVCLAAVATLTVATAVAVTGSAQPVPSTGSKMTSYSGATGNLSVTVADYPCWRGPNGSGGIDGTGLDLIDNAKDARFLWKSEVNDIGWGWGPSVGAENSGHGKCRASGYGGVVVADGRVYLITFVPSGKVVDDELVAGSADRRPTSWGINADDVLSCMDLKTGRTLWKAVFAEKGLNLNWYREGPFTHACVADGKVFFAGTAGRVYALDAVTGKPLWESTVGQGAERAEAWRRDCLQARRCLRRVSLPFDTSPTYADGVLVCSDCEATYAEDLGWSIRDQALTGLDVRTGKILWRIPKAVGVVASPVRWMHKGREYIIAMSSGRTILVEPKNGRILWELKRSSDYGTPAVSEDYVAIHGTGKNDLLRRGGGTETGSALLRITPEKAEIVWEEPAGGGDGPKGSPLIHRGFAYVNGKTVELATGKVISGGVRTGTYGSSPSAIEGLVIGGTGLYTMENGQLKAAGNVEAPGIASGLTAFGSSTVAQGLLLYCGTDLTAKDRLENRCYYCFDLRKPNPSLVVSPPPPPPVAAELAQDLPALLKTLHALNQSDREAAATAAAMVPPASREPLLRGLLSILDEGAGNWQAQVMAGRLLRESGASLKPHAPALLTRMRSAFDKHDLAMFDLIGSALIGLRSPAEQYPLSVITHMRTALEKGKQKSFEDMGAALSGEPKAMALALSGMLPDLSETAQIGIIETLGGMGRNADPAGDTLIQLLNVPSSERTLAVVRALPKVLGGKAAQPLIDLYSRSLQVPQVNDRPFRLHLDILRGIGSVATEVDQQTIGPALANICSDGNIGRGIAESAGLRIYVNSVAFRTYVAVMGIKALPALVDWLKKNHESMEVLNAIASFGPAADEATADLKAVLAATPAKNTTEIDRLHVALSKIRKKNAPPRLAPVPPMTCVARTALEIPFVITDDDDPPAVLRLTVVKGPTMGELRLKPNSSTVMIYKPYSQFPVGTDQFEIVAEDSLGRSESVTVQVNIEKPK